MTHGIVKWFNTESGFGFIEVTSPPVDVFVHVSAITSPGVRTLAQGQHVTFDMVLDLQAPRAANVAVTKRSPVDERHDSLEPAAFSLGLR